MKARTISSPPLTPIIPTGELEGREGFSTLGFSDEVIIPTGELEGREGIMRSPLSTFPIIQTGESEGRKVSLTGQGRTAQLYKLGNRDQV